MKLFRTKMNRVKEATIGILRSRKRAFGVFAVLLLIGTVALVAVPVVAQPPTSEVWPDGVLTIQEAIDATGWGGRVLVHEGTYHEHSITINKPLTLMGEGIDKTILDGDGSEWPAIYIGSDFVIVKWFTIRNAAFGVHLSGFSHCVIKENKILDCSRPIGIYRGAHNTIAGNIIVSDYDSHGMDLGDTFGNIVTDNAISGCDMGIWGGECDSATVTDNTITDCGFGIDLYGRDNAIARNTVSNADRGIVVESYAAVDPPDEPAITTSSGNIVSENTVVSCKWWGIALLSTSNNTVSGNAISSTWCGITLSESRIPQPSSHNLIVGNTVSDSTVGIVLGGELLIHSHNIIHHNNFINNKYQAYDECGDNKWDNGYPYGGNHWSDYAGTDYYRGEDQTEPGSDGVGDEPYVIEGPAEAVDRYPFVTKEGWTTTAVDLKTLGSDLASLTSKVDELEARVSQLEDQLDYLTVEYLGKDGNEYLTTFEKVDYTSWLCEEEPGLPMYSADSFKKYIDKYLYPNGLVTQKCDEVLRWKDGHP